MAQKTKKIEAVIRNYGLMWRRDQVFWGSGPNKGFLKGRHGGREIDFREQIGVYVLYDESRRPIYVGQAGQGNARLFKRLRAHRRDHLALRWQYFSWFGLLAVNKGNGKLSGWDDPEKRVRGTIRSMLNEIEGVLIAATEPQFNKQGARFRKVPRYRQVPLPEGDGDDVTPGDLYDRIETIDTRVKRLIKLVKNRT